MPSRPKSPPPPNVSLQNPFLRTCQGSQTQTQQSAGCNASSAGYQMWGSLRAWHGSHFPGSLQRPLQEQLCRTCTQRHNQFIWANSIQSLPQFGSLQCSIGAESAQHRKTNTAKMGLSHVRTIS